MPGSEFSSGFNYFRKYDRVVDMHQDAIMDRF